MRVHRPTDEVLSVKTDDSPFALLWLTVAALCAAWGAYLFFTVRSAWNRENFQGAVCGAVTGIIGFLALYERGEFTFDRGKRTFFWHRRRALRQRSGVVPFDDIRSIVVQTPIGDDGVPSRRVTVVTESGEVPLTLAYMPDADGRIRSLAESLQKFVGKYAENADMTMESARAAVLAGRVTEAVRILREDRGMSLEEAKRIADELRGAS